MKRLSCLMALVFVAVLSAAPALPPQGVAALSAVLKGATDRGDVPGVVVAVVNKDGGALSRGLRPEQHAPEHADGQGHDLHTWRR